MLHKQIAQSIRTSLPAEKGPRLITADEPRRTSPIPELVAIASRRCSSFFAEAAVLVLVFGILDFFFQRGHISMAWAAGAIVISVGLLVASVATDFGARRWLGAQP